MTVYYKKIRFFFRYLWTLLKDNRKIFSFSIVLGIVIINAAIYLPGKIKLIATPKIGMVGKYNLSNFPPNIQTLVSSGLTIADDTNQILPNLVSDWKIEENGKKYVFNLTNNIQWQNGDKVKSSDLQYNFDDVKVEYPNNQQIVFELRESFSPFPSILTRPIFKEGRIGMGTYRFGRIIQNGDNLQEINLINQNNFLDRKIFRFYPSEEAAILAFKLGEISAIQELVNPEKLLTWKNIKIEPFTKKNRVVALFFNTQKMPFADKTFRQSLSYAIKKEWTSRAISSINPLSWAYNEDIKKYNYDFQNAKELLKKYQENNDLPETLEIATTTQMLETAELIKQDWTDLGLNTRVRVVNNIDDNFQALLMVLDIPLDPDQYLLWHSTQVTNISQLKSPKIDKLLEDGRKIIDQNKRKEIYSDFQKSLAEEVPALFLYFPQLYTVSRF